MRAEPLLSTARAAGMVSALHFTMAKTADWSDLPREGVLRVLADLQGELDRMQGQAMDRSTLIRAQEARDAAG